MSTPLTKKEIETLIIAAKDARKNSYSPYSKFKVGAAVLTEDNTIFVGTNIENASYGLTMCAERNAIFAAITAGYTKFKALALITPKIEGVEFGSPCGACRQVMSEFMQQDTPIVIGSLDEKSDKISIFHKQLKDFMPYPFLKL